MSSLAYMKSTLGLTIVSPFGETIRLSNTHPAITACLDLVLNLPAEQAWPELQVLLANPLKSLIKWCGSLGCTLKDDDSTFLLNGYVFDKSWLAYLQRLHSVASRPEAAIAAQGFFHKHLGIPREDLKLPNDLCIKWTPGDITCQLVKLVALPIDAEYGNVVEGDTNLGTHPGLVAYGLIAKDPTGSITMKKGTVLRLVDDPIEAHDTIRQPVISGLNSTYRCEQGSSSGWLMDQAFDSLRRARDTVADIVKSGHDARIINLMSKNSVSLI